MPAYGARLPFKKVFISINGCPHISDSDFIFISRKRKWKKLFFCPAEKIVCTDMKVVCNYSEFVIRNKSFSAFNP